MTDQNVTGHTGEPWYAHGPDIRTSADERVNIYDHDPSNRERIVACINALAGVPDPAAFVKQAKEAAAAFKAERERCIAIFEQERKKQQGLVRVALLIIRQRIQSGETP
jgi:hypothetical protein